MCPIYSAKVRIFFIMQKILFEKTYKLSKKSLFQGIDNAFCNVLGGEAEFFVEHFVRSRSAKVVKTENLAVGNYSAQRAGQA